MSCTIYYKGKLKEDISVELTISKLKEYSKIFNCNIENHENGITIYFLNGTSEPLDFNFKNKIINSFCKWNGEDEEEFYKIFDLFIELKPLFKSLKIEDDEGLWHEYVIQKKPCKINLKPLSSQINKEFFNRVKENESNPPSEIEKYIFSQSRLNLYSLTVVRIIIQDLIKIMKIGSVDGFKPQQIVELVNKLNFSNDDFGKDDIKNFPCTFPDMLMKIWISYSFTYKKMGRVKELSEKISDLKTSKLAAWFGILSIFLNRHSGVVNQKHAEMKKFVAKYYRTGAFGEVMVIDNPERELEFFFSIMDYLGFNYVGAE
jgi:hypothetical protein